MAMLKVNLFISSFKYSSSKSLILATFGRKVLKKYSQSSYVKLNSPFLKKNCPTKYILQRLNYKPVYNLTFTSSNIRRIHTTRKNNAIPPILLIFIRPIANIIAIVFGRTFRKWWQALPPKQKEIIRERFRRNKLTIVGLMAALVAGFLHYYLSHVEQDPITKRWRFIAFTSEQMIQIATYELKHLMFDYEGMILQPSHNEHLRVVKVANRILKSNLDVPGIGNKNWSVTVVGHPTVKNAFVLPDGKIFIFTGMLDVCDNDDQLGVVLAHEMAHAILHHMAEQFSNVQLVEWLLLIPLVIIWAILPDGAALLSQWLSGRIASLVVHLPFSRSIETEADIVGLELAAKACFDIREASAFWAKMAILSEEEEDTFEWLSTHPSHETREQILNSMMKGAIKRRAEYSCPALPAIDPRTLIEAQRETLKRAKLEIKRIGSR